MSEIRTLVEELERRQKKKDPNAEHFLNLYHQTRGHLVKYYYPFIQASCPWFTDHGEAHVDSIITAASALLQRRYTGSKRDRINSGELFLLLAAILWHDVGMVVDRVGHANIPRNISESLVELAFGCDVTIQRLTQEIVRAHSSENKLETVQFEEKFTQGKETYTVPARALAAVLRFCDEVSENKSRISAPLLPQVPAESKLYWLYANSIVASECDPVQEMVRLQVEMEVKNAIEVHPTPPEFKKEYGPQITLIEYLLKRLEKMNNERAFCAPKFSRYASIQRIQVHLTLLEGNQRLEGYQLADCDFGDGDFYPDIQLADNFFREYPKWKPENLKGLK